MTQRSVHDSSSSRKAAQPPSASLPDLIQERSPQLLLQAAGDLRMTEDLALTLLERRDLPHQVLEKLSKNAAAMKHRKVQNAVVMHPRTPRHVSLPITRRLYSFELMQIALAPTVASDLKLFAEDALIARLESVSAGERIALAKRGSTRIAAALLHDPEARIIEAALNNPYLTEMFVVKAVMKAKSSQALIDAVCHHAKWNLRREVRAALLRNEKTPLARAVAFAEGMSSMVLRDILRASRLPHNVRAYLERMLEERPQAERSKSAKA